MADFLTELQLFMSGKAIQGVSGADETQTCQGFLSHQGWTLQAFKQSNGENIWWNGKNVSGDVMMTAWALPGHPPAHDSLSHTRCSGLDE